MSEALSIRLPVEDNRAGACPVRLYEMHREGSATILTVDRTGFTIYRTSKGKRLRCVFPPADG